MAERKRHFDLSSFYNVLNAARQAKGLTWKQVSEESAVNASTLTRMAQNKRPDADSLTSLAAWAGLNPADFVTGGGQPSTAEPLAVISQCLRQDPNLTEADANALDGMIKAAYQMARRKTSNS